MAIKFLEPYTTKAVPPETFTAGQVVEGRDDASEAHFVTRGRAAYLIDGKLIDRFGKEIDDPFPAKPKASGDKAPDYAKDKLDKLDLSKATDAQLAAIVEHEKVEVPEGAAKADIITAIKAKRAA